MEDIPEYLSSNFSRVYQSHIVQEPSTPLFDRINYFDSFLNENLSKCHYHPNGDHIEGKPRLFEDDIDWGTEAAQEISGVFKGIMEDPGVYAISQEALAEAGKSLNAPFISGLVANGPEVVDGKDVLILCAGDGEDVNRLSHSAATKARSVHMVGVNTLNNRSKSSASYVPTIYDRRWLHNIPREELLEYDLILCHHGLHHVLATPDGEDAFEYLVNHCLRPNGIVIADKLDMIGLRGLVLPYSEHGRSIWLDSYDPTDGIEGVMYVGVGARVWKDPVLSDRRLHNLSQRWAVKMMVVSGRGVYKTNTLGGRPIVPPRTIQRYAERSEVRAVTYIEMRKGAHMYHFVPSNPVVSTNPGLVKWEERVPPDYIMAQLSFRVVKGNPVTSKALWNLSLSNSLFSYKIDGITAKVLVTSGCTWASVPDAYKPHGLRYYFAASGAHTGDSNLRLQAEAFLYGEDLTMVVVDPLYLGPCQPSQFAARVDLYNQFLGENPRIASILPQKPWFKTFNEVALLCQEGVVIMNMNTPPPTTPELGRACLYAKKQWTVDVKHPSGMVWEHKINPNGHIGDPVRMRLDRTEGNSPEAIKYLENALPFDVVCNMYRCLNDPQPPWGKDEVTSLVTLLPHLKGFSPDEDILSLTKDQRDARGKFAWAIIHRSAKVFPPEVEKKVIEMANAAGMTVGDKFGLLSPQVNEVRPPSKYKSKYA